MKQRLPKRAIFCKFENSCKSVKETEKHVFYQGSSENNIVIKVKPELTESDKMNRNCHNLSCMYYVRHVLPLQRKMNWKEIERYNKENRKNGN